VDLEGRFLRANARFCDLTGYSTGELLERSFQDITHLEEREDDANRFDALVAGVIDTYQIEKRIITKAGSVVWVELSASVVRDAHGRPLYGIRVAQDITELKRAEEKQKLLLDELTIGSKTCWLPSSLLQCRPAATRPIWKDSRRPLTAG
jgi:PAS domain S-box-containing protein